MSSPESRKNKALSTQQIPAGKRQQTSPPKAAAVKKASVGKGHEGDNIKS